MVIVYPTAEQQKHALKDTTCQCCPRVEFHGGEMLIIHEQLTDGATMWAVEER